MRPPTDREVYVYALSSPGLPRHLSVLGRRMNCIPIGRVDAIVEYSPGPGRSVGDIQLQHRIVSRLAARTTALLPARFGSSLMKSALESLVSRRQDEIRAALRLVRNCEQMTIRVFNEDASDQREPARHLALPSSTGGGRTAAAVAQAEQVEGAATGGTAYLIARQQRAHHVPRELAVIRGELAGLVRGERVSPPYGALRAVVYHLVARRTVARYQRRASVLPSLLAPHVVTVTGPWPVFAFAPELF
jgi:hypothetical protein